MEYFAIGAVVLFVLFLGLRALARYLVPDATK